METLKCALRKEKKTWNKVVKENQSLNDLNLLFKKQQEFYANIFFKFVRIDKDFEDLKKISQISIAIYLSYFLDIEDVLRDIDMNDKEYMNTYDYRYSLYLRYKHNHFDTLK
jgi:hypothetical protein